MGLRIVVCVKQTPAAGGAQADASTGKVKHDPSSLAMSPFDEYAVEEGVRLKERVTGSTVTALTLGPESADTVLRDAVARGCDDAVHLFSPEFEGSDPISTAYLLSKAVEKISKEKGPVHLVLCGKQTNDGDSGAVGPAMAGFLDWPGVSFVRKLEASDETNATVHRIMEDGVEILEAALPAVFATVKEINTPRVASLKGKMAAKKAQIPKWSLADIGAEAAFSGASGSPTQVKGVSSPPSRPAGETVEGASAEEQAKKLLDKLQQMKLI